MARRGRFVINHGRGGKTHFVLLASNGWVVATSETYESKESCLKGIDAVKCLAAEAAIVEEPSKSVKAAPTTKSAPARK